MNKTQVPLEVLGTVGFFCILVGFGFLVHHSNGQTRPVAPKLRCTASHSRDQDDMCIWVHPRDRSQSTIVTSDKKANMLFVYDLEGRVIHSVHVRHPGDVDVRYNFPLAGQSIDIVALNERHNADILVYKVDPDTRKLERIDNGTIQTGKNFGGALYHSHKTGKFYFVSTGKDDFVEQYELADDGTGKVGGKKVRTWRIDHAESAVADDETGTLYIGQENAGVWQFGAEPADPTTGQMIIKLGENGLVGDIEGLALYDLPGGDDYLIVSNQGSNDFKVYQRSAPHRFVGTFSVAGAIHTGGLEVCNASLGSHFPEGIFVCHSAAAGRPVLVAPWEVIARSVGSGLAIHTEWQGRGLVDSRP